MTAPAAPTAGHSIDHVVIAVDDLGAARDAFAALGFLVQPKGGHPLFGTSNHTIMLANGYVELLAIETPKPENAYLAHYLAVGGGLVGLALATPDLDATAARLATVGVATGAVEAFARPVMLDGVRTEARFRTLRIETELGIHGYVFFCEHATPQAVWVPGGIAHANRARSFAAVAMQRSNARRCITLEDVVEPGSIGALTIRDGAGEVTIVVAQLPAPATTARAGFAAVELGSAVRLTHPALGTVNLILRTE